MELILYTNNSDKRVVTKSLTELVTLEGTLREDCSIVDPVITVQGLNNALAAKCNYAKIAQFGRYYFVNDIIFKGNLFELHLHSDVLASFQTELKSLEAVVARQENNYNLYLNDGMFKTYADPNISIFQFPNGFDTFQYILSVAGS